MRQANEIMQIIKRDVRPTEAGKPVPIGKIMKAIAKVQVLDHRGNTGMRDAAVGMIVNRGDTVITGPQTPSSVVIQFNDGTEMFLCENAFVVFN